eukprot:6209284-Pleurochrysis_carterae.AAC.1
MLLGAEWRGCSSNTPRRIGRRAPEPHRRDERARRGAAALLPEGERRDFAPLLLKHRLAFSERRQRRDEEVALQPSHLLLHLVDQIIGDGLAHGQSLEALRPAAALRTVRRERRVWPARRARGRRARAARLVAVLALLLKQRRHRDLPLIAWHGGSALRQRAAGRCDGATQRNMGTIEKALVETRRDTPRHAE